MTDVDVELIVQRVIVEMLGCVESEVTPEKKLVEDLGADSLDAVEIALGLEEALEIDIPDDAINKFETVQQIVDFCRKEVSHVQQER